MMMSQQLPTFTKKQMKCSSAKQLKIEERERQEERHYLLGYASLSGCDI